MAAAHARADADEDALFGKGRRGDDDPGDPHTRAERVAAALAGLEAERAAREAAERALAQAHLAGAAAGTPRPGRRPAAAEVAIAEAKLARETAAYQAMVRAREEAAGGRPLRGTQPVPPQDYCRVRQAAAVLERARARAAAAGAAERAGSAEKNQAPARRNVTDPDSRLMPVRGGGFIQGYNAQNVTSEDGLVIATRLTQDTADTRWFEPMITSAAQAAAAMAAAGGPGGGQIGLVLADAGYLSLHNLTCPGPDRLIAAGKHRDLANTARDGRRPGQHQHPAITAMTARLAAEDGTAAYRRRSHLGETFHGDLKHNQHFRRLTLRGLTKASAEWQLAAAARNLRKAITSGHLTRQALAALPA